MNYLYVIAGVFSGIIAGMGMGGGTLLIPILVLMLDVDIKVAQLTNLLCFIPLSIVSIAKLAKSKLVNFKYAMLIGIPCMVMSVIASFISVNIDADNIKKYFGIFLIVLGIFLMLKSIYLAIKSLCKYSK